MVSNFHGNLVASTQKILNELQKVFGEGDVALVDGFSQGCSGFLLFEAQQAASEATHHFGYLEKVKGAGNVGGFQGRIAHVHLMEEMAVGQGEPDTVDSIELVNRFESSVVQDIFIDWYVIVVLETL